MTAQLTYAACSTCDAITICYYQTHSTATEITSLKSQGRWIDHLLCVFCHLLKWLFGYLMTSTSIHSLLYQSLDLSLVSWRIHADVSNEFSKTWITLHLGYLLTHVLCYIQARHWDIVNGQPTAAL